MTQYAEQCVEPRVARTRHLRDLDCKTYARSIVAYTPTPAIVESLMRVAKQRIDGVADISVVLRVLRHNPETVSVFARGGWDPESIDQALGFLAQLPVNARGLDALFDGRLDTADPDLRFICRQNEKPSAIYFWGLLTDAATAGGIALVMERMTSRKYDKLPIYCRPANKKARELFLSLGFTDGALHRRTKAPHFMTCTAPQEQGMKRPLFDSYRAGGPPGTVGVKVVHDVEELLRARAIRAATYLAEQEIPYAEDVDGNDLTATHLLGYIGDEPAGCLRLRYFASFVKLERLAVLRRFRGTRLAVTLVQASIDFARTKGYSRFYGQAEEHAVKLWERFGFVRRDGDGLRYMTNRQYFEGDLEVATDPDALSPYSGAEVLLRREGQWDIANHFGHRAHDCR